MNKLILPALAALAAVAALVPAAFSAPAAQTITVSETSYRIKLSAAPRAGTVKFAIRNLSDETHRALCVAAAAEHGRSTEAEVRAILDEAARPAGRTKIGSALIEAYGRSAVWTSTSSGTDPRRNRPQFE